jgi:hypothetical protein
MEQGSSHEPHFLHDGLAKGGGHNPVGVDGFAGVFPGSLTRSATLGFGAQSLWDWANNGFEFLEFLGIQKNCVVRPTVPGGGLLSATEAQKRVQ